MKRQHRKTHYIIWLAIPIALIPAIVAGVRIAPDKEQLNGDDTLSVISKTVNDSSIVIEIQNNLPLTSASCIVYARGDFGTRLLGQVNGRGNFVFTAPKTAKKIILSDEICHKELKTINID
jgi:hypothetical protein